MAEPTRFTFTHQQLAEILAREIGLSEGEWAVAYQLVMRPTLAGPSDKELCPAGLVVIQSVLLEKTTGPSNLSVNAGTLQKRSKKK